MESIVLTILLFLALFILLRRSRTTGSDPDEYVHHADSPFDDNATRRADTHPGPGGPISGSGGGNAGGGR